MRAPARHQFRVERLEDRAVPAVYYVAPTGSDAAAGSDAAPWRTLQHAANRVAAGDTVVVRAGDYTGFHLTTDGTAAARITFSADPNVRVTARNATTPDGINLEGADYVTVQGFTVVGMPRTGIRTVLNTGVTIRNNVCDLNEKWGILTGFSSNLLIEGNTCTRSKVEHGIYVSNSADNPVVRGNTMWGNRANGLHMNGDVEAGGGDGIISNALVENNVVYDNGLGGGSGINCDGVQNSVIRNNLIYNAHASGISLYRINGGGPSTGNRVVNNTVLVASDGRWALNIGDGSVNNTVRNNVFFSAHSFRGAVSVSADSMPGLVSDYNIVEDRFSTDGGGTAVSFAAWRAATGQDANSFTTSDPGTLFVNAAGGDYHLAAGSAAVDRGSTTGAPPTDFEGTPRPSGAGVDIGHDELAAAPPLAVESFAVADGSAQRSRVTSLRVTFNRTVAVSASNFTLTGFAGTLSVSTQVAGGRTVATISLSGGGTETGSLADGRYTLNVVNVPGLTGPAAFGFHRLFGDANGDGTVNLEDYEQFGNAFGGGDARFDFNADGAVNLEDYEQFGNRFGISV